MENVQKKSPSQTTSLNEQSHCYVFVGFLGKVCSSNDCWYVLLIVCALNTSYVNLMLPVTLSQLCTHHQNHTRERKTGRRGQKKIVKNQNYWIFIKQVRQEAEHTFPGLCTHGTWKFPAWLPPHSITGCQQVFSTTLFKVSMA